VFGDWENPYLTLEPSYEAEIIRSFARFVEAGLVYQSKKPVYWSTGAQTALAEAEVEYADRSDPAIFVKFPRGQRTARRGGEHGHLDHHALDLPANVAIAIHPRTSTSLRPIALRLGSSGAVCHRQGPRARLSEAAAFTVEGGGEAFLGSELVGSEAQHPFLDRTAKIIAAEFVTMDTGTGQVHIAPGHGADDYLAGVENGLPILSPVDEHGRFTEEVGVPVWAGKYVFDANKDVIAHLRENGTLLAEQIHEHSYPHCWRSKTPVVFRAVEQFFIRIDKVRGAALAAIDNVQWLPHWGRNRIHGTVESRPDWCISRQRSWGCSAARLLRANGTPLVDGALARPCGRDRRAGWGRMFGLRRDDAWWAEALSLPGRHDPPQRHARRLDRFRCFA
jgi:isoleucyl-tRNA synthetase